MAKRLHESNSARSTPVLHIAEDEPMNLQIQPWDSPPPKQHAPMSMCTLSPSTYPFTRTLLPSHSRPYQCIHMSSVSKLICPNLLTRFPYWPTLMTFLRPIETSPVDVTQNIPETRHQSYWGGTNRIGTQLSTCPS